MAERDSYTMYTQQVDGQEAIRVIYNPAIIHPWAHFSSSVVESSLEFFDNALGAPTSIDYGNQIWQVKVAFNALGLIGFVMFVISLTKVLVNTKVFASLKRSRRFCLLPLHPARPRLGSGSVVFWPPCSAFWSICLPTRR